MAEITSRTLDLVPPAGDGGDGVVETHPDELTVEEALAELASGELYADLASDELATGELYDFPTEAGKDVTLEDVKFASFQKPDPYIEVFGNGLNIEGALKLYADLGEALAEATA